MSYCAKYCEYLKIKDKFEKEVKEKQNLNWWRYNGSYLPIYRALKRGFNFVENYKENDIYEKNGIFIPYAYCNYSFKTLEDCKARIDIPEAIAFF